MHFKRFLSFNHAFKPRNALHRTLRKPLTTFHFISDMYLIIKDIFLLTLVLLTLLHAVQCSCLFAITCIPPLIIIVSERPIKVISNVVA